MTKLKPKVKKWNHEDLVQDLAECKGTFFYNVPLGSVLFGIYAGKGQGTPIADVLVVKPSYTQFCVSIFEIKVTRADFMSDIRSEKWRKYLPHCHRFYFATPQGLVHKKEIPDEAGLIIRSDKGWTTTKMAWPQTEIEIPYETMMALVFMKNRSLRRERAVEDVGYWKRYQRSVRNTTKRFGKKLGYAYGKQKAYEEQCDWVKMLVRELEEKKNLLDEQLKRKEASIV